MAVYHMWMISADAKSVREIGVKDAQSVEDSLHNVNVTSYTTLRTGERVPYEVEEGGEKFFIMYDSYIEFSPIEVHSTAHTTYAVGKVGNQYAFVWTHEAEFPHDITNLVARLYSEKGAFVGTASMVRGYIEETFDALANGDKDSQELEEIRSELKKAVK